ncbi:MAG: hypothetical protein QF412_14440 [Planctomycetota bacterium]|nr:hypothetical protein [Planctomycetota bacterium]
MNYLGGVDEAGLGPLLGPLVVAGVALAGPKGECPWELLDDVICRDRMRKGKIRVADSKKVHQGKRGLERLEQTALSFWGAHHGHIPQTVTELLEECGADLKHLRRCPWYEDLDIPLPLVNDPRDIELRAHQLAGAIDAAGMELLSIAVRTVDVEEFNQLIEETDNKSRTHFRAYSKIIAEILKVLPEGAHLVADRCGGLMHYLPSLRRAYPKAKIERLEEGIASSSYRIRTRTGPVKVTFTTQGEDRSFPTALASCTAKYFREIMVKALNRWFAQRVPELRPTAGYYQDGRRFLEDVAQIVDAQDFPRSRLIRVR